MIGVNRMPVGKTTVIGAPNAPLSAFFFAADNSPGFATLAISAPRSGLVRMAPEPFVAGCSNGRKTPPAKLADLMAFMAKHSLTTQELLNIPELSAATYAAHRARMQELTQDLARKVELPEGQSASVGDLLAVDAYQRLMDK